MHMYIQETIYSLLRVLKSLGALNIVGIENRPTQNCRDITVWSG